MMWQPMVEVDCEFWRKSILNTQNFSPRRIRKQLGRTLGHVMIQTDPLYSFFLILLSHALTFSTNPRNKAVHVPSSSSPESIQKSSLANRQW
ncbi:hypothetical protein HanXRQr2_Chr15g0705381 [Helianthus annuus]|uniref:Uncharacterized protein n=1 Tax=Helianthus annuus TaxID=4232 RepID=A0A251SS40_HELAN|nr:hypothetical protein HanXRQr2_Chr15g0705381 [Helianthus annuus]KAJ0473991.1 hypothetical protein HanHA89_Chr15g0624661 [Helianthus annuus]